MLSVVMLSAFMLSVFILSVIMLSVIMLNVVTLSVMAPQNKLECLLFASPLQVNPGYAFCLTIKGMFMRLTRKACTGRTRQLILMHSELQRKSV